MCDTCTRRSMLFLISALAAKIATTGNVEEPQTALHLHGFLSTMLPPDHEFESRDERRAAIAQSRADVAAYMAALKTGEVYALGNLTNDLLRSLNVVANNCLHELSERAAKGDAEAADSIEVREVAQPSLADLLGEAGIHVHVINMDGLGKQANTGMGASEAPAPH